MRIFPAKPPLFDDQQCDFPKSPELRQKILEPKKGIIFLVGTPGSGKSTTCAALIHEYARLNDRHILTFEDPIEFVYPTDLKSLISQRDMRTDMVSELLALKSGLRQVPSLLVVQEIRDEPTAALVLILASLGIRVITTIHADTACEAVGSFLKWLDGKRWSWGCFMLSKYLVCSIAQRLVTAVGDNSRRYVLHELLWAKPTPRSRAVSNLIAQAAKDEHSLDGLDGQILNGGSDTLHISWRSSLERWEQAGVKFDESLADELSNLSR
jgi:Tfp pilus assembly pilus retraction ATPase PilT